MISVSGSLRGSALFVDYVDELARASLKASADAGAVFEFLDIYGRIGIATQDSVSVGAMRDEPRHTARRASSDERRTIARASSAVQAERTRQIGSAMQFAALTLATGGGAYLLVTQLYVALTIPLTRISAVLGS